MSLAQDITQAMGGQWHGTYGLIPTPGHSAKDRGSKVADKPDAPDGVLFTSYNGGDWRTLKDECRARGLLGEWKPNGDARPRQIGAGEGWRVAGVYEYVGADGAVAYRTVRKEKRGEPKRFEAQRPDGRGGWISRLGDVERIPYRLPEILAAEPGSVVYLVEGERKADKLASWGLTATAVPFGAKGWRESYARVLAPYSVVILPDNDAIGREFAERARQDIAAANGSARIIELPGLPPKGDVIDWTGTADELRALIDAPAVVAAETFDVADLTAWARTTPTAKAFVLAPFIPRDDVVIVTGDGGTNKSTLALQISACSAAGKPVLGLDVTPGPALYVTAEDDNRENHWRLSKIAHAIGTTLDQLAGRLHVVSLRGRLNNELATFDSDGKLRPAPAYALLRATIEATGAKLVTLDNVAHLFAGNENDRGQVTAFINLLYQLCGDLGVTILLIAHRNKSGDSYSGSTAWLNAVRSQLLLERVEGDPDVRKLSLGKANYARQGEELLFRWHDFALVRDEDLAPGVAAEIAAIAAANADDALFLRCLAERNRQGRPVSERVSKTYAPVVFADMLESKGIGKARLERAMDRLFRAGAIERGFLFRDTAEGKDKHGLRQPANGTANAPLTPSDNVRSPLPPTPANTHYPLTGGGGAAPQAAAPFPEEGQARAPIRRPIFAEPVVFPDDEDPAAAVYLGDQG